MPAKIIADSVNPAGNRITTMVVRFPRFILAEWNTHRQFSRNAASSRAIPTAKIIDQVQNDPAMPIHWGKNQPGMKARSELSPSDQPVAETIWLQARDQAVFKAQEMLSLGVHKQIVNRMLEPWMKVSVLVTATEWDNFFKLRCHPDAQPEMQHLALEIKEAFQNSTPVILAPGEWHTPFGDRCEGLTNEQRLKVATARAARISYETFDGQINPEKDFALHDDLAQSGHWSPFEHSAVALMGDVSVGNFRGWKQYRKFFAGEDGK